MVHASHLLEQFWKVTRDDEVGLSILAGCADEAPQEREGGKLESDQSCWLQVVRTAEFAEEEWATQNSPQSGEDDKSARTISEKMFIFPGKIQNLYLRASRHGLFADNEGLGKDLRNSHLCVL